MLARTLSAATSRAHCGLAAVVSRTAARSLATATSATTTSPATPTPAPAAAAATQDAASAPASAIDSTAEPADVAPPKPKASIPTYASARLDMVNALKALPKLPSSSILMRFLVAARHSPVERSLDEIEDLLRKWRAARLPVPMAATHHATLLAVEQGNPFRAVGWLGNPVDLGLSPSRKDLQVVLDALLVAVRNGQFTGKVRGERHLTFRVALGVLGLYPVYGLGKPGKDAYEAVIHTCLSQGTPGGVNAAWHLLSEIADLPHKQTVATELARLQFHQGTYTTNYLPNQPDLLAGLAAFERAVQLERPGGNSSAKRTFQPMTNYVAVAAINKLKAEVIGSKDVAVRNRSKKAFEQSWKNRGIAFHADLLTKFIQEKQLRAEIEKQAAEREAKKVQAQALPQSQPKAQTQAAVKV
ncbi:hypothetical protein BCR44DRAFT_36381 [Catenaria anguillulae PL171]|uniref:Uncharacterized protein n=1 Tax=Catenaria anguillulae PL171 TaxID=765915 RepID=A0A1Y2HQH4_9FUNG|nr:hypothetical protein BCR44DRAFT_36381 [Catenaria anguillulae PL171]